MIVLLCGTNRPGSNTRKVTARVEACYQALGVGTRLLDLAELPEEIFSPRAYENKPVRFARFADTLVASDGLVIVTPEYNGGIPGILKYFIDMLPFPDAFEQRPICFVDFVEKLRGKKLR